MVQKFSALHKEAQACFDAFHLTEGQQLKKEYIIRRWQRETEVDLGETETNNLRFEVCRKQYKTVRNFYDRELPLTKGAYTLYINIQDKVGSLSRIFLLA